MRVALMMSPKWAPPLSLQLLLLISGVVFGQNNWSVNYTHNDICAVRGSTVTIGCSYMYNSTNSTNSTCHRAFWGVDSNRLGYLSSLEQYGDRVQCLGKTPNDCSIRITDVTQEDEGKYYLNVFKDKNGVMLSVTALHVETKPVRVFLGDEVILTCKSTCNLTETPTFFWYKNSFGYSSTSSSNLRLPSVTKRDDGDYRCAVQKYGYRSRLLKLKVLTAKSQGAAYANAEVVLNSNRVRIYFVVVVVFLCGLAAPIARLYYMRRKRQKASNHVMSSSQQNAGEDIYTHPDPSSMSSNDMYNTLGNVYSNPTDDTYTALDLQTRSNGVYGTLAEVHSSPADDTYADPDPQNISPDYCNLPNESTQQ